MIRIVGTSFVLALVLAAPSVSQAALITYFATLSGPAESPPNASPGTGFAQVDFDLAAHSLHISVTFSGLLGTTTASHIHAATTVPGTGTAIVATQVPTFSGFPLGVTSGTYDQTFDTSLASFYNPAYVTANGNTVPLAEAAFATALAEGRAYLNIHTTFAPGGEIRGFLAPIPEPSSIALLGCGAIGVLALSRRRKARA
ncbi:CHRD domain-containing protein [Paludisphaera rhizosphaerae]|uniref:CHRD domain-containing protein n=1 Tax=Paludisphaera rhizosphaerae TaxID=2711216 RepID=UPI0013EC7851|nr:CHRD domain-containing protein [Paludisphaera rhizosphaerae]